MLVFELVVSAITLFASLYLAYASFSLPLALAPSFWVSAGAFPFIMSSILCLLSVWWIIDNIFRLKIHNKDLAASGKKPVFWLDEVLGTNRQKLHFAFIIAAVVIYVFLLIPYFGEYSREYGFVAASFLFLCVTIKFFNEISLLKAIVISGISVVIIYLVFHSALRVLMPT